MLWDGARLETYIGQPVTGQVRVEQIEIDRT